MLRGEGRPASPGDVGRIPQSVMLTQHGPRQLLQTTSAQKVQKEEDKPELKEVTREKFEAAAAAVHDHFTTSFTHDCKSPASVNPSAHLTQGPTPHDTTQKASIISRVASLEAHLRDALHDLKDQLAVQQAAISSLTRLGIAG